ncbi:MAG: glycine oxidase ThiO [Chlorobi bacterium]|nr:glycine oxidase ThiO [Chlorobiota bacterium]
MSYKTDICVIGGGIAGLTSAYALIRRGVGVAVVESGTIDSSTSTVAAGMLAPLVEARLEEREIVEFGLEALLYWKNFASELEAEAEMKIDYRSEGTLVVGVERDHIGMIRHLYEEQTELGLPAETITNYEGRKLEPYLSPTLSEGLFSPNDHQVDNRLLMQALYNVCAKGSVQIFEGCSQSRIDHEKGEGWWYRSDKIEVQAKSLVVATGASLKVLSDVAPELSRLVRPVKGQVVRLDQSETHVLDHVVRTPEVYLVPKSDGTLVIGASSEDRGFDKAVRLGPLYETLQAAWETVPVLYELPVIETSVGFRPASIDHAPIIGQTSYEGLYLATGYYRHGILFAPLGGDLLANHILDGTIDERIKPFSPERFNSD